MPKKPSSAEVHKRQREYIARVEESGFDYGLTVASAFVRSIRDLGYKSAATAVDELVDNAVEAGAQNLHVAFGYGKSNAKPEALAIMDDGWGMVPEMIRAAVVWGGTDREGSRDLFGRYGYGLPSASVSQGKRFTVYSRVDDGKFHAVTLDVDDIGDGKHLVNNRVVVPEPVVAEVPDWVTSYADKSFPGGAEALRTVVVWEKLDRITWKTTNILEQKLLEHLGLTYRSYLRQTKIMVNGKKCEPIDPLFTTPNGRFYDIDEVRAEALPTLEFKVKGQDGKKEHLCRLRISYMPFTFFAIDKTRKATSRNANPRFQVRRENHGMIVCRNGRQIDVVTKNPLITFMNNDRNIGLELDFPAELDEEFGVTTAKQQITISPRIWEILKEKGFLRIMQELRRRYREDEGDLSAELEKTPNIQRPSETVMGEVNDLLRRRPATEEAEREAEENLQREIERAAAETGLPTEVVAEKKKEEVQAHPFKVTTEHQTGGPFFRAEQHGGQMLLILNRAHRFYTDIYAAIPGAEGAKTRAGLELLLFAIGQCELDATGAVRVVYMSERIEWSTRLNMALTLLDEHVDLVRETDDDLDDGLGE